MEKIEIELYFRAESKVVFGDEVFTDDTTTKYNHELEYDPEDYVSGFMEYEIMYQAALEHLNFKAEKIWCKYDPPTAIEIRITQMTKEEFFRGHG
jgi:hypothetical protein